MSATQRRLVSFAGSAVIIEHRGSRADAIVNFLYRRVPAQDGVAPHMIYRLTSNDDSGQLTLYRDDKLFYESDSKAALAELLLGDTCHNLAKQSQGGLLFHAGGLAWQGKGILLPGKIGAGKTTLVAWLVARGLGYLTDEMVFVPHGANHLQAFTRPLNLKHPSKPAMQDYVDFEGQAAHILRSPHSYLISPEVLSSADTPIEPPLGLIVFPRYLPDEDFELRSLSKAQAGLALMQCLVNARNLQGYGFPEIVRLAQAAPACRLTYSHFDQIEGRIETLLSSI